MNSECMVFTIYPTLELWKRSIYASPSTLTSLSKFLSHNLSFRVAICMRSLCNVVFRNGSHRGPRSNRNFFIDKGSIRADRKEIRWLVCFISVGFVADQTPAFFMVHRFIHLSKIPEN
jgi:hypothetical protein